MRQTPASQAIRHILAFFSCLGFIAKHVYIDRRARFRLGKNVLFEMPFEKPKMPIKVTARVSVGCPNPVHPRPMGALTYLPPSIAFGCKGRASQPLALWVSWPTPLAYSRCPDASLNPEGKGYAHQSGVSLALVCDAPAPMSNFGLRALVRLGLFGQSYALQECHSILGDLN